MWRRNVLVLSSIVACLALSTPALAKVMYADSRLQADITDGRYSVKGRGAGGEDGDAYRTIQSAVNVMKPGDTLLLRGGVFKERAITLGGKRGSEEAWFTIRSYPGEWAVVDGGHEGTPDGKSADVFGARGDAPAYWRFQWFEVTGGGPAWVDPDGKPRTSRDPKSGEHIEGAGFSFNPGEHLLFDHLHIHHNYQGIWTICKEDGTAAHDIVVTHCRFKDNGFPKDATLDAAQVVFCGDHAYFGRPVNIHTANTGNEVRYNLMDGSGVAYRDKYFQFLVRNHVGDDMEAKARGNRIHHNIIRNTAGTAISITQDFSQVYNNVVDSESGGILIGKAPSTNCREPFHVVVYNNLLITRRTAIFLSHGSETEDNKDNWPKKLNYLEGAGHPFCYSWNNIFEGRDDRNPGAGISAKFYRGRDLMKVDMSTVHIDNNYFYGWRRDAAAICVGGIADQYSVDQYQAKGWAKTLYAAEANADNPLHQPGSPYKVRKEHKLDGSTIGKGGVSVPHPYLENVAIPGYVGPAAPDDDKWVDDVLDLSKLGADVKAP